MYVLAFKVSPWVAGVLLASHVAYEWLDYREHRKMVSQLEYFKQLGSSETEESKAGNC